MLNNSLEINHTHARLNYSLIVKLANLFNEPVCENQDQSYILYIEPLTDSI